MKLFASFLTASIAATFGCGGMNINNVSGIKGSGNLKTETRNVSGFKKIKAGGVVKLDVAVQKDFSMSIETDDNLLTHVTTEVNGDTLVIGSKENISPSSAINIKISMPDLIDLDLSGASTGTITAVKTDALEVELSGASKIKLDGEVKSFTARASGASNLDAENLRAENAEADSSGASTVAVTAANEANLSASGASTVIYTGEPKNLKQNSSGASSIKKK